MKLFIRKSQFAVLEHFTKSYVSLLIRQGIITPESNGLLNWRKAHKALMEYRNRSRSFKRFSTRLEEVDINGLIDSFCRESGSRKEATISNE